MAPILTCLLILSIIPLSYHCMVTFFNGNGLTKLMLEAIDNGQILPDVPLVPVTTGWNEAIDWQLKAPVIALWPFGDGRRLDVLMAGWIIHGAFGGAWSLVVLESLRKCNHGKLFTYVAIIGIIDFNLSFAMTMPLYTVLHLLTSPSATEPTVDTVQMDPDHLISLIFSIISAYIFPMVMESLPAPQMQSLVQKQTIMAWYQQWPVYISLAHHLCFNIIKKCSGLQRFSDSLQNRWWHLRNVYGFAFALSALPHVLCVLASLLAVFFPGLYPDGVAETIRPRSVLLEVTPFSKVEVESLFSGIKWLFQLDHWLGTSAIVIWAIHLHISYRRKLVHDGSTLWRGLLLKTATLYILGGPISAAIWLIWERDVLLLSTETKSLLKTE